MESLDKVVEGLEDIAIRHNSKIMYWHVKKLRGNGQFGIVTVKDRNAASISDGGSAKERCSF